MAHQGVVPGYQPLRQAPPAQQRSNTAGKHGAQQQLTGVGSNGGQGVNGGGITPQQSQNMPVTANSSRVAGGAGPQLKYKKQGLTVAGQDAYTPHSNPNFSQGQAFGMERTTGGNGSRGKNQMDRSDPSLTKKNGSNPSGQIQIQSIIRGHYQGAGGTGAPSVAQHGTMASNSIHQVTKSKSTNQRPLRSSRQQIQTSLVSQLQSNTGGAQGAASSGVAGALHQSFDAGAQGFSKGTGGATSRLPAKAHVAKSLTSNQTPQIQSFHPPAIQKTSESGSRRNARHAQINKNHPELVVQNSQTHHGSNNEAGQGNIIYGYSKRGQNSNTQGVPPSHQAQGPPPSSSYLKSSTSGGHAAQNQASSTGAKQAYSVRPNTASEARNFIQQYNQSQGGAGGSGAGGQGQTNYPHMAKDSKGNTATVGSPILTSSRHGLAVPQPNNSGRDGLNLLASSNNATNPNTQPTPTNGQASDTILAASSARNRRTGAGGSNSFAANTISTPKNGQATPGSGVGFQSRAAGGVVGGQRDQSNPMSLSQDQSLQPSSHVHHRRAAPPKEDTFFPDKKGHTATGGSSSTATGGGFAPAAFGAGQGGLTDRGPGSQGRTTNTSQTLDAIVSSRAPTAANQGLVTTTANSASHLSPLIPGGGNQHHHQRLTSQHAQSIPQYRKANLRDLRKSQRLSNQQHTSKDNNAKKSHLYDPALKPQDSNTMINPLTSVELNSHFKQRQSNNGQQASQGGATVKEKGSSPFEHYRGGNTEGGSLTAREFKTGGGIGGHQRGKETNRSLDTKRQLLIPSNSGLAGVGGSQLLSGGTSGYVGSNNVPVNKSLQPNSQQQLTSQTIGGHHQQNNSNSLVPQGYKRRTKRPGQSLNQLSFSHQGGPPGGQSLTTSFAEGSAQQNASSSSAHHIQNPSQAQQHNGLNSNSNAVRKRLELQSINLSAHQQQRRDHHLDQSQPLSSERNKHSRQKALVASSVDAAHAKGSNAPRRVPSVNSLKRGGGGGQGADARPLSISDAKPQLSHNSTPKGSKKDGRPQETPQQTERFNAITKFAFATSCGHQPGNPYKVNQDTYTLAPNMCGQQGFHLFCVCDGHGVHGHKVSADIKAELPQELESKLQNDQDFIDNTGSREFQERIPRYFRDAFADMHDRFMKSRTYDCNLSGSTVCAVLFDSLRIYCANAGDSRAVLYTQGKKGGLKVTPLSEDHKPCLPKERARVEKVGGRVNPIIGPQGQHLGPDRVWMATEDTPGLAMSRSLGDGLAHSIGVSWEPEVKQLVLEPADKFIVIASDGVWEFLSNEQIARIVWPYYIKNSPEQAGNAIVRASAQKWKENDTVIDDITCITIFLEVD